MFKRKIPGEDEAWKESRYTKERTKMVEEQLINRNITDQKVLEAMKKIPRHLFVEEALRDRAYGDHPIPIGEGQTISQPYMVAIMTQLLDLHGEERVLEIGTGSGYQTAILAELSQKVYSIERITSLASKARYLLENLGYTNILIKIGDGTIGWFEQSPFERIIVTAGAPEVPQTLFDQLKEKGKMVIPVGDSYSQVIEIVEKIEGKIYTKYDCGCVFVRLIGKYGWKS